MSAGRLDGNTNAGSNSTDLIVAKYNSSGTKQWARQLGTSSDDHANGVATDSSGNVFVTGRSLGALDNNTYVNSEFFLIKYNSSGTKLWTKLSSSSQYDSAKGVAVVSSGFVYVTGETTGMDGNSTAGSYDLFLVKYNSSGIKQ